MAIYLKIVLCICFISTSKASFFDRKVSCMVTNWSPWSSPDENGQRIRTCRILRLPANGGLPCPHTREVKDEGCNCTIWSGWSESFGFGQKSRTRNWMGNLRRRFNVIGTYGCKNVLEEDIRYTGWKPEFSDIVRTFGKIFVTASTPSWYEPIPSSYEPIPDNQRGKVRDILLILDSSGSVQRTDFTKAKKDAKTLFGLLCPKGKSFDVVNNDPYQHHQLAMITFSTTVVENFFFNSYEKTYYVLNAITKAKYLGHRTNTAGAFRKAKEMFEKNRGARKSKSKVKQEVLILTDGLSNEGGDAVAAAKDLSKVADVYGLMIGKFSASGMEELTEYVSKPASQHLFSLENFNTFSELVYNMTKLSKTEGWCTGYD
ncbi:integrin alpha-D-like [Ruditapes philippinarum]|uniref:integrin alpha-D-like n=1 Tax=Ruditapes philippinarum TaxID=129788 RepID=UPI00295C0AFD|nr:integrin alpha-D-like [Ruditapes philippinarum]